MELLQKIGIARMARGLDASQVHRVWEGIYDYPIVNDDDGDDDEILTPDGGMTTQQMRWGRPPREVGDRNRRGRDDRYKR